MGITNNIVALKMRVKLLILIFFTLNISTYKLLSTELVIKNNSNRIFYIYDNPLTFRLNGELLDSINPNNTLSHNLNGWIRIKDDSFSVVKVDIKIENYSKKVIIENDTIIISNLLPNTDTFDKIDSVIYFSNEEYFNKRVHKDLKLLASRKDTLDYIINNSEYFSPSKITAIIGPISSIFYESDFFKNEDISIVTRSRFAASSITYLLSLSMISTENKILNYFNYFKQTTPKIFKLLLENELIKYYYENLNFFYRVKDFIELKQINLDTNKTNIFYFTGSWCVSCNYDLNELDKEKQNLNNVKVYIIAFERNTLGVTKIKDEVSKLTFENELIILKSGVLSKDNERLAVQAVPQIYLYKDYINSKQIRVYLHEYLKSLEN